MAGYLWPGLHLYECAANEELISKLLATLAGKCVVDQFIERRIERVYATRRKHFTKGQGFLSTVFDERGCRTGGLAIELPLAQNNPQLELEDWLATTGHELAHTFFFGWGDFRSRPRFIDHTDEEEMFCEQFAAAWLATSTNRAELRELLLETLMRGEDLWFELEQP